MLRGGANSPAIVAADHFAVNNKFRSFGEVVRVYQAAVDVGYGQLEWRLRSDPRVAVFDRLNFRLAEPAALGAPRQPNHWGPDSGAGARRVGPWGFV